MRILVACEFSGVVRDAFRARGHDAVSCDLLSSERPGPHITGDVRDIFGDGWDLLIAHPPCTFLANSGAKHLYLGCRRENGAHGDRWANLGHAVAFFLAMLSAPIPRVAVENPIMLVHVRRLFGHSRTVANDPAVAIRTSRDQGDLPVAEGTAAVDADRHRRRSRGAGAPRAARSGAMAEPEPDLCRHSCSDGGTVGRGVTELKGFTRQERPRTRRANCR
jgi:nitrogen fixation protein